ncbi:DNA polymerase III subunit delta' [Sulfurovum sp. zt1-1]|uniref:DNA polymerase III subunit delta n=1 Tax=Sulfurovum zhangzhouensis TaxID=3019067 RepID=A0ABT7R0X0_9BACT|nr:DNA polymerase III subunit delta' [Sulfurovum zhangzhouensis]MDM5272693.1 DNA polymerase III subunit delta' [Sulfurovum zhangzhouensis]
MSRLELTSQVVISSQIEETIKALEALQSNERIIKIVKEDNFLVEDAALAIEKAYLASEETTVIILAARIFSPIVQNKLLKVIEEPPPNKEFILITPSKATILATIRSRLPIQVLSDAAANEELGLDISQLSLETVYTFVQEHKRTAAAEMKRIVEEISKEAMHSGKFNLDEKTLNLFSNAFMALDMGSPPTFVLNTLLLKLLAKKKR